MEKLGVEIEPKELEEAPVDLCLLARADRTRKEQRRSLMSPGEGGRTNPDFTDGLAETFVGAQLVEGDGVELALVQVGHGALALLLPQGAGGIQRVLEAVAAEGEARWFRPGKELRHWRHG